ncbi:hypothetical protein Tco_0751207 [Tanacetum coccineum]|uniref:Uncharacterized protein n=1 Tax=Tanacetum coccineum TaxID=301880 RepID=A0ABQ4Z4J3_9ASTR
MALNRSKSRYSIKECSTCGSWYTKECCSIGNLKDQIIVPVSDSFQHCAVCGTPVDGPYCHGCTLIRTKFEKDLFTYCVDNGVFQNLQDTPESSNDNTNVVNAPREPSVVDQDDRVIFHKILHKSTIIVVMSAAISVETLVSNPSESDDFSLGECNLFNIDDSYYEKSTSRLDHLAPILPEIVEVCVDNDDTDDDDDCDMPVCDESSPIFTIFSNPLFDSNENFSSDDESLFEEEIQKDEFNSFSNPLYDIDDEIITNESYSLSRKDLDEIILIPPGIDEPCFNAESDLLESLLNRDSPIDSTKTDSIFDEFSFPRLPEEHNSENVDTIIESLSYSPIPVEDSDSLIEEIDLFLTSDDSMPPGIESDDYDSEGDFRFLEELLINDSLPLPENESYNLNSVDNPESPVVKSCFNFEPVVAVTNDFDVLNDVESFDSGEGENVDSLNVEEEDSFTFTIRSFLPFVTYPEVLPVSYSTGSEDKVFNPGIFDNDAFKDKSSKELAPSKALLTLDVFDPLHPPLMDFHVTKAFSGFTFSLLKIFSKKFVEPGIKNVLVYLSSLVWGGFHLLDFLHHCYYPP